MTLKGRLVGSGGSSGGGEFVPFLLDGLNVRSAVDGAGIKYRAITSFTFLQDHMEGKSDKLEQFLGAARYYGVNTIRVFATWENKKFTPLNNLNYYDDVEAALEYAKSEGFYVHLVALCDQVPGKYVYMPYASDSQLSQLEHVEELVQISHRVGNVILFEISNEDTDGDSGGTAGWFPAEMFTGLIASRSTWFNDENPWLPDQNGNPSKALSAESVHLPRSQEFFVKGKTLYECQRQGLGQYPPMGVWTVSGEPARIADGTNARQHADNAAVCELFGGGGLIHGGFNSFDPNHQTDLQNCVFPTGGVGLDCIKAVSDVWDSGLIHPYAASHGRYTRGGFSDCPIVHIDHTVDPYRGAVRTYAMELDGFMFVVVCGPGSGWKCEPVNGWKLEAQGGYVQDGLGGNVMVLGR